MSILKKKFMEELLVLKDHLVHVHSQYRAFKAARDDVEQNRNVATIEDWSANRKLILKKTSILLQKPCDPPTYIIGKKKTDFQK